MILVKGKKIGEWNRLGYSEIDLHKCSHLIFDKSAKVMQ